MHRYIFTVLHILTKFVRKETQNMAYSILDMSPNCCSQFGLYNRAHFRDSILNYTRGVLLNVNLYFSVSAGPYWLSESRHDRNARAQMPKKIF